MSDETLRSLIGGLTLDIAALEKEVKRIEKTLAERCQKVRNAWAIIEADVAQTGLVVGAEAMRDAAKTIEAQVPEGEALSELVEELHSKRAELRAKREELKGLT